jgi:hypothetical protein
MRPLAQQDKFALQMLPLFLQQAVSTPLLENQMIQLIRAQLDTSVELVQLDQTKMYVPQEHGQMMLLDVTRPNVSTVKSAIKESTKLVQMAFTAKLQRLNLTLLLVMSVITLTTLVALVPLLATVSHVMVVKLVWWLELIKFLTLAVQDMLARPWLTQQLPMSSVQPSQTQPFAQASSALPATTVKMVLKTQLCVQRVLSRTPMVLEVPMSASFALRDTSVPVLRQRARVTKGITARQTLRLREMPQVEL